MIEVFIGAVITWLAAWFYYRRAGAELRAEANALHKATGAIIYFLEYPGAEIQVKRDVSGKILGLVVRTSGSAAGTSSATGTLGDVNQE